MKIMMSKPRLILFAFSTVLLVAVHSLRALEEITVAKADNVAVDSIRDEDTGRLVGMIIYGRGHATFKPKHEIRSKIVFVTVTVRPNLKLGSEDGTLINIGGAWLGYRTLKETVDESGSTAELLLIDPQTENRFVSTRCFIQVPADSDSVCGQQVIVLRLDRDRRTIDVFVDGMLRINNARAESVDHDPSVQVFPGIDGITQVVDLAFSQANPLFDDANVNGVPDDHESDIQRRASRRNGGPLNHDELISEYRNRLRQQFKTDL
jgi:hypothetical protein